LGRGDRLQIGPETLLRGQIWPASEALHLGLIDQLGSDTDALNQTAHMAHLWHYQVSDLYVRAGLAQSTGAYGFFLQNKDGVRLPYPSVPGLYMLYIPPLPVEQK
jgi:ClpP class serine protease